MVDVLAPGADAYLDEFALTVMTLGRVQGMEQWVEWQADERQAFFSPRKLASCCVSV